MFQQPAAAGDLFKTADHLGSLVLIWAREYRQGIVTSAGVSDAIAGDVHVLQGPGAGEIFENTLLFGKALVPSLQSAVGQDPVLARIGQGIAKAGQTAPWILQPYTENDAAVASAWITAHKPGFQKADTPPPAATPAASNGSGIDTSGLPPEVVALLKQTGHA